MSEFFRPKLQQERVLVPQRLEEEALDDVLVKNTSPDGKAYAYGKYTAIDGTRYFIEFAHSKDQHEHELSVHFGLAGIQGSPVTNAGLEVFGKIADELSKIYEEITSQEKVERLLIKASEDSYSKDEAERAKEIIAEDPKKLDGLMLSESNVLLEVVDGVAKVTTNGRLTSFTDSIPVSASFIDDVKRITRVDISNHIPKILNFLKTKSLSSSEKQIQRLKLYQFYLHRRYPQFTFNSRVTVDKDGKRELEFGRDKGEPYLLVTTNSAS